jgi:hypothetical protein
MQRQFFRRPKMNFTLLRRIQRSLSRLIDKVLLKGVRHVATSSLFFFEQNHQHLSQWACVPPPLVASRQFTP